MKLVELFKLGGVVPMILITFLGLLMIYYSANGIIAVFSKHDYSGKGNNYILLFSSLAITIGFLVQALGMFQAFDAIQQAGDISPSLVVAGLKISMIAPLYGAFIFIISLPVWFFLREKIKTRNR